MERNQLLHRLTPEKRAFGEKIGAPLPAASPEIRELTPEELRTAAGGWNWDAFTCGSIAGGGVCAIFAGCMVVITGPVGLLAGAGITAGVALAGAAGVGTLSGALADDEA